MQSLRGEEGLQPVQSLRGEEGLQPVQSVRGEEGLQSLQSVRGQEKELRRVNTRRRFHPTWTSALRAPSPGPRLFLPGGQRIP